MLELSTTGKDRSSEEESALFQFTSGEPHLRRPVSPGVTSPAGIVPPAQRPEAEGDSRSRVTAGDDPPKWMSLEDDIDWSILSNAFFVAGGLIYVIGTTWDYAMYSAAANPEYLDVHSVLKIQEYVIYQGVWIMGPLVYFLNSVIDVKWAMIVRERDSRRKHLEKLLIEMPDTPRRRGRIKAALMRPKILLSRMRKHIGHRRQLGAATTFGMGALLGLIAAVCSLLATDTSLGQGGDDYLSNWAATLESASVHVYLVSAIFALWRNPSANGSPMVGSAVAGVPWYSNVESLETLGDVFFGAASFIDVVLQDVSADDGILWLPIISSVLWTVDALLYLRGDFASLYKDIHLIDFGEGSL